MPLSIKFYFSITKQHPYTTPNNHRDSYIALQEAICFHANELFNIGEEGLYFRDKSGQAWLIESGDDITKDKPKEINLVTNEELVAITKLLKIALEIKNQK